MLLEILMLLLIISTKNIVVSSRNMPIPQTNGTREI